MTGADQLHAVLLHHVVNTLGWPSLRPLQQAALGPLLAGEDALLLAPTAGGKTEAAVFPLLSRMQEEQWTGLSVVYVTPLRALLNNLQPRLDAYARWLGRRAEVWHGDTAAAARRRLQGDPPDVLLTTPESLEAMLISTRVDAPAFFAALRAVVVDELHAFAGDDRGWHLLAVLSRLQQVCDRPLQRVGLSATVGNPAELLAWLQRGGGAGRPGRVVGGDEVAAGAVAPADLTVDHVGTVDNAATVIAALHRGEKRLVFADSRRRVEELARALRERDVTTFVSHSSLAAAERRRSEAAFAQERDCVIVATSTLELGVDVGDLDRVIQIDAPLTVASFLQRLGRTGRRQSTSRNTLFLGLSAGAVMQAAALLHLWGTGWVEPVVPPPRPAHIAAQQVLALVLERGRVGEATLGEWWQGLPLHDELPPIVTHLVGRGFLHREAGMLSMGTAGEAAFGRRHFAELTSVFTAAPTFTLRYGRTEVGLLDPVVLTSRVPEGAPRVVLLAGRSWRVTHVDWARHVAYGEPAAGGGTARWQGSGRAASFEVTRAAREVLLGANPPATLTRRAQAALAEVRESYATTVHRDRLVVTVGESVEWWTWAGTAANQTLLASLPGVADPDQQPDDRRVRLLPQVTAQALTRAVVAARSSSPGVPTIDEAALRGLKFGEALPRDLAVRTLTERLGDALHSALVLMSDRLWVSG